MCFSSNMVIITNLEPLKYANERTWIRILFIAVDIVSVCVIEVKCGAKEMFYW